MKKSFDLIFRHHYITLFAICSILALISGCFYSSESTGNIPAAVMYICFVPLCLTAAICFKCTGKLNERSILALMFIMGLSLRVLYILATPVSYNQHDVEIFGHGIGHSGYIEYIANNNSLPDFDPVSVWQFYHPPLHHIIMAVLLKLQIHMGFSFACAVENLQFAVLFYSCVCSIVCVKIFKLASMKGLPLYLASAFVFVNPTLFFFSGSINNDCLSTMFLLLTLYFTIKWYREQSVSRIIPIALSIGLGMITKLSVGLVSVGVAAVFITAFIKEKRKVRLIRQYAAFGAICVPSGLSWTVRNLILFNTPVNYVPALGADSYQYVGNIPELQRLFDFSPLCFSTPFIAWGEHSGDAYYEYNPTIGYLKTACFEEYFRNERVFSYIFLTLFIICVITAIIGLVYFLINFMSVRGKTVYALTALTAAVSFASYYVFCISYPHVCTMNARYVTSAVLFIPLFCALLIDSLKNSTVRLRKLMRAVAVTAVSSYCVMSFVYYSVYSLATAL